MKGEKPPYGIRTGTFEVVAKPEIKSTKLPGKVRTPLAWINETIKGAEDEGYRYSGGIVSGGANYYTSDDIKVRMPWEESDSVPPAFNFCLPLPTGVLIIHASGTNK